ncbi:hypothetical protein, partial [Pseudomonas aeruginosa]|uniref:hypothetical protein n=1 Tax=Pseudomonas aeruginosa TaxID=287 RepID=UPI003002C91B
MRPEVAQERRYLQGAPLGLELPGRIALRDPHCAWQWFEPEAAAEAFPAAHWLAADGSVGLALRDPQYDELRRIAGHLARLARGLVDAQA